MVITERKKQSPWRGVVFRLMVGQLRTLGLCLLVVLASAFIGDHVAMAAKHAPCINVSRTLEGISGRGDAKIGSDLLAMRFRYARDEMARWLRVGGVKVGECGSTRLADKYTIRWNLSKRIKRQRIALVGQGGWRQAFRDYQSYVLKPQPHGIEIGARSGLGLIYGTYAFLEHQGYLWIDTDISIVPNLTIHGLRLSHNVHGAPSILLRGFWGVPTARAADVGYIKWMVRNRLNIIGGKGSALSRMLGVWSWFGDHTLLQDAFSPSFLYASHPEWYSIVDGRRRPVAPEGVYFNPNFSSSSAAAHFSHWLLDRYSDQACSEKGPVLVNVWPTDSRADRYDETSSSHDIGNHSDNLLYFDANLLDRVTQDGKCRLNLGGISYYSTWSVPTDPRLLKRLAHLPYLHLFYLNERTYSSPLGFGQNTEFPRRIKAWKQAGLENAGSVDYINYSIFGTIAITNYLNYPADFYFYARYTPVLYAYMHPIRSAHAGPRRLSNLLVSHLSWLGAEHEGDYRKLANDLEDRYFRGIYGSEFKQGRKLYSLFERSLDNAQVLFGKRSLSRLLFQRIFWARPPYSAKQVAHWIPAYLRGGSVDIPVRIPPLKETPKYGRLVFRGLRDSLSLQARAGMLARELMAKESIPGANMAAVQDDLAWYKLSNNTYRLLRAVANFYLSMERGDATAAGTWKASALRYITDMKHSRFIHVNLDEVNQTNFIKHCESLLGGKID